MAIIEDLAETRRLIEAGQIVGIPLDDHVIIGCGTNQHVSIRGLGQVEFAD